MAFDKDTVRVVIFEAHTPAGKAFDVGLIVCILISVAAVMVAIFFAFAGRGHKLDEVED